MKCLSCNSSEILENVGVLDRGNSNAMWDLSLVTQDDPHALIFKGTRKAPMRANVCKNCGYVMMFADTRDVADLSKGKPPSL